MPPLSPTLYSSQFRKWGSRSGSLCFLLFLLPAFTFRALLTPKRSNRARAYVESPRGRRRSRGVAGRMAYRNTSHPVSVLKRKAELARAKVIKAVPGSSTDTIEAMPPTRLETIQSDF